MSSRLSLGSLPLAVVFLFLTGPAAAQSVEDLEARIQALEAALEDEESEVPATAGPAIKRFDLRGRVQFDFGHVESPDGLDDPGLGTTTEFRRARLGAQGEIADWYFRLEADFADAEVSLADAIIEYRGFEDIKITGGHHFLPASLQRQTSSNFIQFFERGTFDDAYGLDRELGISVDWGGENWHVRTSVFNDGGFSGDDEASGIIVGTRGHVAREALGGLFHAGAWVVHRDAGAEITRLESRPPLHTTDTRFVDTGPLPGSRSDTLFGVEAAGRFGSVNIAAEWSWDAVALEGAEDPLFSGGYLEAGWFVTGETRSYSGRSGKWGRTAPARPLGSGGWGALQLNAGVDFVDLNDAGVRGGEQTVARASAIWIALANVRFAAQYAYVDVDGGPLAPLAAGGDFAVDTFGLRAQLDW